VLTSGYCGRRELQAIAQALAGNPQGVELFVVVEVGLNKLKEVGSAGSELLPAE